MRGWLFDAALASGVVPGCAPPPSSGKLPGKWQTPTGGTIEFKSDGTAVMSGPRGAVGLTYRQPSTATIELHRDGGGAPLITWRIKSLDEHELVLDEPDGPQVLRRVP